MLLIPASLTSYRTLADRTFRLIFGSNELTPEQSTELHRNLMQFGYLAFKGDPFKKEELEYLDGIEVSYEDTTKTPSKRLRAVLYKLWEKDPTGYTDYNLYYQFQMEKIISHYKSKLD